MLDFGFSSGFGQQKCWVFLPGFGFLGTQTHHYLQDEEEEIDIHLHGETDEDELIIDGDNHGEKAANLEVDIVPYEFHDDTGKYYALWG